MTTIDHRFLSQLMSRMRNPKLRDRNNHGAIVGKRSVTRPESPHARTPTTPRSARAFHGTRTRTRRKRHVSSNRYRRTRARYTSARTTERAFSGPDRPTAAPTSRGRQFLAAGAERRPVSAREHGRSPGARAPGPDLRSRSSSARVATAACEYTASIRRLPSGVDRRYGGFSVASPAPEVVTVGRSALARGHPVNRDFPHALDATRCDHENSMRA